MNPSFIHLHIHSEYSLLDSTVRIPALVEACARMNMPALALTDQNNLFALVKFYQAAEAAGIKPIAGADLWITNAATPAQPHRLTLLCQNRAGYLNLTQLISRAYIEGQRGNVALVNPQWFEGASTGLIALCGRHSDIGQLLIADKHEQALQCTRDWLRWFDDRLYFELTRTHGAEEPFLKGALHVANAANCPVVASNDVRFLFRDDFEAHEARVCIHDGRVLNDPKRPHLYTAEQYFKSPTEMAELFADLPGALENSIEIAKRCNLELTFGKYYLPAFPVPSEHTLESFIRTQSHSGLELRLAQYGLCDAFSRADYDRRLNDEIDVIIAMGFPGYFLIVADFINWAKHNGIPVGPGRGSGAGSLVAYALGITDLDPLRYDLLFERFLNPERVSMPDFDVDFCMDRRDEVIAYVSQKYGHDRVSQIITYGTMAAKAAIRDTGRVLGLSYGHVDSIAKLIPNTLGITLDLALKESVELRTRYENEDEIKDLLDLARKLEDLTRNAGKHAGGVVIAPSPLTDFAPLYCEPGGSVVTQFDKDDVETVGLVKFDFLGLRTLTIIDWAVKSINARHAQAGSTAIDIALLPTDDAATYQLLKTCQTTAVFQLESRGMKELVRKLKPDTFEDIIALVALFRPGPLQSGMVDDFINRKHGRASVSYPHPKLEAILKPTYGVIVYQEQVMQIAQVLAGYSLGEADLLRRAMGKKKAEEMAKQRAIFVDGAIERGISGHTASAIFDLMEKFAEYGFNKSHSAAYALVAYQTAWLKAHYPTEFMAAVLSADMDNTDKVVGFLDEARALKLNVLPPDVNASDYLFTPQETGCIRYGLGAIKGVGRAACEAIVAERRRQGAFTTLLDFCQRLDANRINKRVLEALIYSGALDALASNRATLASQLPEVMKAADQAARALSAGQHDIFGTAEPIAPTLALPIVADWPIERRLNGERETLGHYLSGHPTDLWRNALTQLATCPLGAIDQHYRPPPVSERRGRPQEQAFIVAGLVVQVRKRGESMGFVQLEDWSGRLEVSFFREAFVEFSPLLTRDALLVIEGGLLVDDFNGEYQLRARNVYSFATACEKFTRLVRVKLNGIIPSFIPRLENTLKTYRGGNTPLRLHYRNGASQAELELGQDWRVRACPELKRALDELEGVITTDLFLVKPSPGGLA